MKHTLLIVEDGHETANMLQVYFEAQGYSVILARDGQTALDRCQAYSPDLILLDIRLPDFNGFEVSKRLQGELRTSRLPIIFVTERRERDYRIEGLKLGAVDYITKPFDLQELRLRVRNVLSRIESRHNHITNLPAEKLTYRYLDSVFDQKNWVVMSVVISGLDTFNKIYGFVARDDVLRAMALILTSSLDEFGTIDDMLSQPHETQFIIITRQSHIMNLRKHVVERLKQALTYFYPLHDREIGYVLWDNSQASREYIPFMHIFTTVVSSDDSHIDSVEQLQQVLASPISLGR
ncbi:MAG: hypothetical protein B6242_06700 [Anaerolineaceae bacterium 4572_78]|nr:MAG: hypothetical protein B6242_06700 [Anaerolineaceae bacterium 4572_78]